LNMTVRCDHCKKSTPADKLRRFEWSLKTVCFTCLQTPGIEELYESDDEDLREYLQDRWRDIHL
jgi:hypothetical protein